MRIQRRRGTNACEAERSGAHACGAAKEEEEKGATRKRSGRRVVRRNGGEEGGEKWKALKRGFFLPKMTVATSKLEWREYKFFTHIK